VRRQMSGMSDSTRSLSPGGRVPLSAPTGTQYHAIDDDDSPVSPPSEYVDPYGSPATPNHDPGSDAGEPVPSDAGGQEVPEYQGLPLPPDWQAIWNDEQQDFYYYNAVTEETTWERPESASPERLSFSAVWSVLSTAFQETGYATTRDLIVVQII